MQHKAGGCSQPACSPAPPPGTLPLLQAHRCRHCNYTAERRRPECSGHAHLVEVVQVTKRWWACEGCAHRFTTVGVRHPTGRCPK